VKILQLLKFPLWGSGSGTYTRKLSEKLVELGEEVAIVCPEARKVKNIKIYPVEMPFPVAFTGHPEWKNCKKYSELTKEEINQIIGAFWKTIEKAIKEFQPDVIHVQHASFLTWVANYLKAIYGLPYIITSHGTDLLNASLDRRYLPLTKDALNRSEAIVCVSGDTRKWLLKIYSKKFQKKTKILPGGVDISLWESDGKTSAIDKKYGIKDKQLVIFSGKLTKPKGVEYLIKAAAKIKAEIFILGGGDDEERLQALAQKLKTKNVRFLGYFDQKTNREYRQIYDRAEVVVVPSIWDEPLGLVVLEAMASRTPVVASNKGGIPLAVKDGVNGFLVRPRSAKEIAESVNLILRDPKLREKMGAEARKTVEEKFDWTIIAKKFINFYRNAAESSMKARSLGRKLPFDISQEKIDVKSKKVDYK